MEPIYQQILLLLTNPPGNLIYHIVLAFAITAALQGVLINRRAEHSEHLGRALFGLGILLAGQIGLFLASGLTWQGVANPHAYLPPLDRAITLFSLIWILWMWAFPSSNRIADSMVALLSFIGVIAFFGTLNVWVTSPSASLPFNGSVLDWSWELATLVVLMVGLLVLLIRRPDGWGVGLGFLLVNLVGHAVQFLWPGNGDFSGVVRLAQLCSYPLLPTLAQRMVPAQAAAPSSAAAAGAAQYRVAPAAKTNLGPGIQRERRRFSSDPRAVQAWLEVAAQTDPARLPSILTHAVAQTMLSDICFLIAETAPGGDVRFVTGYDLIREEEIPAVEIERSRLPTLSASLQRGRPLRFETGTISPDLKTLGERFGLQSLGGLLFIPVLAGQRNLGGFLFLSPYSNRDWTVDDQNFFSAAGEQLGQLLQPAALRPALEAELDTLRRQLEDAQQNSQKLTSELDALRKQPASVDMDSLLAVQKEAQETITALQAENTRLRRSWLQSPAASRPPENEVARLEQNLHETLQEVAVLQNKLAEANMQMVVLQKQASQPIRVINEEREIVKSYAQELRQPMASLTGYTELLMSESAGILGALQRKFLERIKAATERMRSILDDLVQITTSLESSKIELISQTVHAGAAIDKAIADTRSQLQEKNINLQLDLPEELPNLRADRDALQQILVHLLQNAGLATPPDGTIALKVRVDDVSSPEPYLLFQITDSGGGIAPADLPKVFSRRYRADNPLIQGVGDSGVGLAIAKTLTEAHNGRIWVESDPGKSTTFSILLPIQLQPVEITSKLP